MPFRMVDRIDAFERGTSLRARKLTSAREDYWKPSHDGPVMPPELVLESLLQAAGLLVILSTDAPQSAALPISIEGISGLGRVVPGDVLTLDVQAERFDEETAVFSGLVTVGEQAVLRLAAAMFVLVPLERLAEPADVMTRVARMQRDPSADGPGAAGDAPLSLLASS